MYPTGRSGRTQPFTQPLHTHLGKRFERKQHGFWENKHGLIEPLLCHACEQSFSAHEDYAKRFFYGKSKPLRLQLPLLADPVFTADYKKLKLFQLSILWRASEAKGEYFSAVRLSDEHRERLRTMLLANDPGKDDEYSCGMARMVVNSFAESLLKAHGIAIETGMFAPAAHTHPGWESFTFLMGGLGWFFCVSETGVPEIMRNGYMKESGEFYLTYQDGGSFLYDFARRAVTAGNLTKEDAEGDARAKRGIK
jgi:hypothetical protein